MDPSQLLLPAAGVVCTAGGPRVPLGVGIHTGPAFMGPGGTGKVCDITALGDEVDVAARLSSAADAGQIVFSARTRQAMGPEHAAFLETLHARFERLVLEGKRDPVPVYRYGAGDARPLGPAPEPVVTGSLLERVDARLDPASRATTVGDEELAPGGALRADRHADPRRRAHRRRPRGRGHPAVHPRVRVAHPA